MSGALESLLVDYALGVLPAEARTQVEDELGKSPELKRDLDDIQEALASLTFELPPARPRAEGKNILLAGLDDQLRFEPFTATLAEMFDASVEKARAALGWLADPRRWELGGMPGVELLRCEPGPKAQQWQVGFIRFAPGLQFPKHRHLGEDHLFVMSGEFTDTASGETHKTGDMVIKAPGTEHAFEVDGRWPCLVATRFPGIEILP